MNNIKGHRRDFKNHATLLSFEGTRIIWQISYWLGHLHKLSLYSDGNIDCCSGIDLAKLIVLGFEN